MTATASGDSALSIADTAETLADAKKQAWTFTQIDQTGTERPDLKAYVITNGEGKVLVSKNGTNAFSDESVEDAKSDPAAKWILNTSDGATYQLLNAAAKQNLDVDGSGTKAGTKVGLYTSASGETPSANQTWTLRDGTPTGAKAVNVQTAVGAAPTLPDEATLYYAWGEGQASVSDWDTSKVDVAVEGTYEATGTAKDLFGNEYPVTAKVYVGPYTVTDPVSATVLVGSDAATAETAINAAKVYAHVKASPAFQVDAASVKWDFAGLEAKLKDAKAGDAIAIEGTAAGLPAKATLYVTGANPENVADSASNLTVTGQQTEYNKGDQWKKLTDGDTSAEAWITWNSKNDWSVQPTATVNFGSEREVAGLTITYGDHVPASAKAEYTTDGTTWKQFGSEVKPEAGQTVTFTPEGGSLKATQVRIVNTQGNDYMVATELEAYVVPVVGGVKNIAAASGTNFSVNFQEGNSSSNAIDGKTKDKGWSTWASTASTIDPVATFTFDKARTITEVKTFFYRDGRASWPKSQTLEYQDENGTWKTVDTKTGWYTQPSAADNDSSTDADTPTVDFVLDTPVTAKAIRLTNTLQDTKVYINVAEIQVFAKDDTVLTAKPAADATLGDLRLDGETIDGFDPAKTDYTVDLPYDAETNPVLQAFAADNAATVKVTGEAVKDGALGGKDVIDVTSADGTATKTYTVTYNAAALAALKVTGPAKTTYEIGDKLDLKGLTVTAVYKIGDKTVHEEKLAQATDGSDGTDGGADGYVVSGFDSTTAGKKTVTVSYRGVSATFDVTVKATSVAPGPEQQPGPGEGNGNGSGDKGDGKKPGSGSGVLSKTGSAVAAFAAVAAVMTLAGATALMLRKRRS
nr:discoidin domain-containing protein [Bifidobacterium sp. CP2]